jgi:hypothetical protein
MDESRRIFPAHTFARISDRLITSPILGERKKTVDPAENRDESLILGDDMSQCGEDMVLRLRSCHESLPRGLRGDPFQLGAGNVRFSESRRAQRPSSKASP